MTTPDALPLFKIESVTALVFPFDREHDLYQEYYRLALRSYCESAGIRYREQSTAISDGLLRKIRTARHSYRLRGLMENSAAQWVTTAASRMASRGPLHPPERAGRYLIEGDDGVTRLIAIDANDTGDVFAGLAERCDVYFKSNFWPAREYPANVLPLANLNPLVGANLPLFRRLRDAPKTTDLFAFFRLWGGKDEVEGVAHNLALIEALAKAPGRKFLKAYLVAGDIASLGARLSQQGIEWTTEPMTKTELWERAGAARLNMVRLGMHECSPWRMIDILAMGGCPVIDYGPRTRWPEPLVEGEHFLSPQASPGGAGMDGAAGRIAEWMQQPGLVESIGRNTAKYFEEHLAPVSLGREILETVRKECGARSGSGGPFVDSAASA